MAIRSARRAKTTSVPGAKVATPPPVIEVALQRLTSRTRSQAEPGGARLASYAQKLGTQIQRRQLAGRYVAFFYTSPLDRIEAVRTGVPSRVVPAIAADLGLEQAYLIERLGLARSTVARKVSANARLSQHESESVLGLAQIVGQVEAMVAESGAPDDFDAAAWVGEWMTRPQPALGNRAPVDLLDTSEGLQLVMQLLQQSQTGAYA